MMLSEGLLNKQIAYELSVSEATVKAHVSAILQKLDVESRTQAVIAAAKIEPGSGRRDRGDLRVADRYVRCLLFATRYSLTPPPPCAARATAPSARAARPA